MIHEVEEYLRQRGSMVLATNLEGEVRAATTCFALGDNMAIYFLVFEGTVKHRGIMQHPQVSLVVDDGFNIPMRGVEIIGNAQVVHGAERHDGQQLLTKRYPDLKNVWDDPRILIVRVTPDRVRFTDWTHGIGQSREASLPPRRGVTAEAIRASPDAAPHGVAGRFPNRSYAHARLRTLVDSLPLGSRNAHANTLSVGPWSANGKESVRQGVGDPHGAGAAVGSDAALHRTAPDS